MSLEWSAWSPFPDPREYGILTAPFGPGCYEIRNGARLIAYGKGANVASRMSSLLPGPWGCGTRNNKQKRQYIFEHLEMVEYRTLACATDGEAKEEERKLQVNSSAYLFPD